VINTNFTPEVALDFAVEFGGASAHALAEGQGHITARGTWDMKDNHLDFTEGRAEFHDLILNQQILLPGKSVLTTDEGETWFDFGSRAGAAGLAAFSLTGQFFSKGKDALVVHMGIVRKLVLVTKVTCLYFVHIQIAGPYQVSIHGLLCPAGRSLGYGVSKALDIQRRVSAGSITSSISNRDAALSALPVSYASATILSNSTFRSSGSSIASN
jgi:hypothetical protein